MTAEADAILAIRQAHGFAFGKSDLFFLVALRAAKGQAQLQPQAAEVADATWMPLQVMSWQDKSASVAYICLTHDAHRAAQRPVL